MFSHQPNERVSKKVYFDWFLLSFLAGHVNAGGFLSSERFVTHVTGFATLAGVDLFRKDWFGTLAVLSIPFYFLLGVMLAGLLTEKKITYKHYGNKYSPVMGLVAIMLGAVAYLGHRGFFGTFGDITKLKEDYLLLALLCGASGLQNAAITSASGFSIRTTHLTGLTTDLGLGIIRYFFHGLSDEKAEKEWVANKLRIATIFSFIFGSLIGAYCYFNLLYLGFSIPSLIALYAAVTSFFSKNYQ